MRESILKGLGLGTYTVPRDPELIPKQAAQDSLSWISSPGNIELSKGRLLIGAEETASSYVQGEGWGYRADGTSVHFRKTDTKIQYYNTSSGLWVDIVTGLTNGKEYTFSRYTSPAGTFVYATGYDGIYKIHTANPASSTSLYNAAKNFKGKSMIATSRMWMWDIESDKTGLYNSYIDKQDTSVYTNVPAEATAAATSGTLAFKAGGATRTCFGIVITITAGGQVFTDNKNGLLVGSAGGTGTINYTTGAWTLSVSSAGTANYFWEDSNAKGITDFTFSATRLAGEGTVYRQDEGGDAIQKVEIFEGIYLSLKNHSVYAVNISSTPPYVDLSATNIIFRKDIGLEYWQSSVVTGKGIIFMNTSNLEKPQLTILQKNLNGDNLEPVTLANHFDFADYLWNMCAMTTYGEYVVFSGRTKDSLINNRLFLYSVKNNTVDTLYYGAKTITSNLGYLYVGDTQTYNIYNILSGFDDDNSIIDNYWISNDEMYGSEFLKKVKKLRVKGLITKDQILEVYVSYDNDDYTLVGTIRGDGSYVDYSETYMIGSQGIGTTIIGGETDYIEGNMYLAELKIPGPKFRKRSIKLVASGTGYVSVNLIDDFNIMRFEQRLPVKYRSKQNVSLDGTQTDLGGKDLDGTQAIWKEVKVGWNKLLVSWKDI